MSTTTTELARTTPATTSLPTSASPTFADLQAMAGAAARSGLFGVKSADQALTLMLLCQADGLHPIDAMRIYHVIEGRPAMRADAMLARFQQAGGRVQWTERTDAACAARFSHPAGGEVEVRWTIDDARKAGLSGKQNWQRHPRQMLSARVISEGVRAVLPGVVAGMQSPEEVVAEGRSRGTAARMQQTEPTQPDAAGQAETIDPDAQTAPADLPSPGLDDVVDRDSFRRFVFAAAARDGVSDDVAGESIRTYASKLGVAARELPPGERLIIAEAMHESRWDWATGTLVEQEQADGL